MTGVSPELVSVTTCEAAVPVNTFKKVTEDGAMFKFGVIAVPDSDTVCGLLAASSAKVSVPLNVPLAVGANVTETEQLAPGPSNPGHECCALKGGPLMLIEFRVNGASPELLSVTDCVLEVPFTTEFQVTEVGLSVTAG